MGKTRIGRCTMCGKLKIIAVSGSFKAAAIREHLRRHLNATPEQQTLKSSINMIGNDAPWGVCGQCRVLPSAGEAEQVEFVQKLMEKILLRSLARTP